MRPQETNLSNPNKKHRLYLVFTTNIRYFVGKAKFGVEGQFDPVTYDSK